MNKLWRLGQAFLVNVSCLIKIFQFLLAKGARGDIKNSSGKSALDLAKHVGNAAMAKAIIDADHNHEAEWSVARCEL